MICWEYRTEYIPTHGHEEHDFKANKFVFQIDLEKHLNELGSEGWELVQIPADLVQGQAADGFALFKRKKEI